MLTISEAALKQVAQFFDGKDIKPVRIFITNGCSGPQLAMAVDEKKENDLVYQFDAIKFLVEKTLMTQARPIKIDFGERGFVISSQLPQRSSCGCGGCGSSDSCCS
jgi:iron-sulfur cluster assembly protein